ncbi:MAG: hypothetical protein ACRDZ4_21695 [Egibacteraceae bacterium]
MPYASASRSFSSSVTVLPETVRAVRSGGVVRDLRGCVQLWTCEPLEMLPRSVIEHWLSEHWDGAHDKTLVDGEDRW